MVSFLSRHLTRVSLFFVYTERDNECESKVKDIAFEDNDTEEETDAKLKMLKCYNYRLEIRKKRCAYVCRI